MTPLLRNTLFAAILATSSVMAAPRFDSQPVFPPEHFHNHSPGVVETAAGDLISCWFHGRGEKGDDTLVIRGARKRRGAKEWSSPFLMADNQDLPDQNCVLFIDPQQTLWLFWVSSLDNTIRTFLLKYRTARKYDRDGPPQWDWQDVIHVRPKNFEAVHRQATARVERDFAKRLAGGRDRFDLGVAARGDKFWQRVGWMTRTHPIMLSRKRMMLPLYSDHFLCSLAAFTEDGGKTWEFSEPFGSMSIQPSFVRKKNGDIVAMMRDRHVRQRIPISTSKDQGQTWSEVESMEIPNPGSSVECIILGSGHWLLVCNDTDGGPRKGRYQLSVYLSDDEGKSWKWKRLLEQHGEDTAASYPSVIQSQDGTIHCLYTFSPSPGETIKHVWFDEAWVREGVR